MADVGVVYTLNTAGTDITFNQYTDPFIGHDQYYITEIRGLESPSLRTPFDPVPLGDGALIHNFWYGARHIAIEGIILVQSTQVMDDIVEIRNTMTDSLSDALNDCLRTDATLTFDPQGSSSTRNITVRYEVPLEVTHVDNYLSLQFSFGLIAGNPST